MKGYFIYNEFLGTNKFQEITKFFQEAALRMDICLEVKSNSCDLIKLGGESFHTLVDFVLFWDKDIALARYYEDLGVPVYNSSEAIAICDNKIVTHQYLWKNKIPMPKTVVAPMTYANIGYTNTDFLNQVEAYLGYPMIVKEAFGSFGEQVYFVAGRNELESYVRKLSGKQFLFQEYIASSKGQDIRIQVVGNQVVAAMHRISQEDFRANITNGAKMEPWNPTKEQCSLALRACKATGASFAGVDLLFGEQEEPLLCEVNSNGHFVNLFHCTKVNVAEKILEWIREENKKN